MDPVVIVGPTAIGKTDVAISIAKKIDAEIISADSMQIYKYMDIGTAKPSKNQREVVKHYFLDFKEPCEKFSAGEFAKRAEDIIGSIFSKGKNVLIVGGTGFYVEALVNGISEIGHVDSEVKLFFDDYCKEVGSRELFRWLEIVDEKWACKVKRDDCQRIKRALSVFVSLKKPLSEFFLKKPGRRFKFITFVLFSSREFLHKKIFERSKIMVEMGIVEETRELINKGFIDCDSLKAIGYREAVDYINGKIKSKDELIKAISKSTIHYAKRQLTFFRSKFKDAFWINVERENPEKKILDIAFSHFS